MKNYTRGFMAEAIGVTLGVISLQQINQVLELVLLVSGIVSTGYGFWKFVRTPKK